MPLSWVVSLKKKFLRFPQHFPYPFVLKLEECCLFLLLAWRVEMMYDRKTERPCKQYEFHLYQYLLFGNIQAIQIQ